MTDLVFSGRRASRSPAIDFSCRIFRFSEVNLSTLTKSERRLDPSNPSVSKISARVGFSELGSNARRLSSMNTRMTPARVISWENSVQVASSSFCVTISCVDVEVKTPAPSVGLEVKTSALMAKN